MVGKEARARITIKQCQPSYPSPTTRYREAETPELPNTWQEIQPDEIYRSSKGRLVSFSMNQIKLGILNDPIGKHLLAINKGLVPPKGNTGLVPSEEPDYDFQSKILSKGGERRFHDKIVEGILH